ENAVQGGAGSAIAELLAAEGLSLPLLQIGIPDRFIEHGSRDSCLVAAGLDAQSLAATVERWWSLQPHDRIRSVGSA
ncbi:MAG: transketolase C-terminal domain-containing protein, partial [Steroidobacteraceae bacterium]